ncbi:MULTISPECIES: hypothetical protein [unclassified Pseudoalteromonas]|uniref:hypothetical protein n=1 Tax=unclassified Pseudoalteromonas TaxID=194690 RepID=UPI0030157874
MMNILLLTAATLGQLCYHADKDINDNAVLEVSSYFHDKISHAKQQNASACWDIDNQQQYQEALKIEAADATTETFIIK